MGILNKVKNLNSDKNFEDLIRSYLKRIDNIYMLGSYEYLNINNELSFKITKREKSLDNLFKNDDKQTLIEELENYLNLHKELKRKYIEFRKKNKLYEN